MEVEKKHFSTQKTPKLLLSNEC